MRPISRVISVVPPLLVAVAGVLVPVVGESGASKVAGALIVHLAKARLFVTRVNKVIIRVAQALFRSGARSGGSTFERQVMCGAIAVTALMIGSVTLSACGGGASAGDTGPSAGGAGVANSRSAVERSTSDAGGTATVETNRSAPKRWTSDAASRSAVSVATAGVQPKLGSPSQVHRTPGGENSIQNSGHEVSLDERVQAAKVLVAYLRAYAAGDGNAACALLPDDGAAIAHLNSLGANVHNCSELIGEMSATVPPGERKTFADVRVLSVRLDGDSAFAIYTGPGHFNSYMSMYRDATGWHIANPSPGVLQ